MQLLCEWQMDLFNQVPPTEYEDLRRYTLQLKESHEKVRKSLFGRLDALNKEIISQKEQIYMLQVLVHDLKAQLKVPKPVFKLR